MTRRRAIALRPLKDPLAQFGYINSSLLESDLKACKSYPNVASFDDNVLDSLRRNANARNVSFRISLRWSIYIINPNDKTKLFPLMKMCLICRI